MLVLCSEQHVLTLSYTIIVYEWVRTCYYIAKQDIHFYLQKTFDLYHWIELNEKVTQNVRANEYLMVRSCTSVLTMVYDTFIIQVLKLHLLLNKNKGTFSKDCSNVIEFLIIISIGAAYMGGRLKDGDSLHFSWISAAFNRGRLKHICGAAYRWAFMVPSNFQPSVKCIEHYWGFILRRWNK